MEKPTPPITITHTEEGSKGAYTATIDGMPDAVGPQAQSGQADAVGPQAQSLQAEMTYSRASDSLIIIDHTGVPDELRGMGVGVKLVERAVTDARASGTKIIALCPFAKAQFDRHKDWQDVLN